MRKVLTLVLVMFGFVTFCQTTDYKKVILPSTSQNVSTEERLIQLAWRNNPRSSISRNNLETAEYGLKLAKWTWLDYIGISGNLNEITLDRTNERSEFFPRYNFSLSMSLGALAKTPLDVKVANEAKENAEADVKLLKLQIRSEVLQSYETYKLLREVYEIQALATEDLLSNFQLTEERFRNGEASLNEYNSMLEKYNNQRINSLNAEHDLNVAKYKLEQLIGLPLEEVL